jgi:predicted Zn-dependent protease
VTRSIRLKFAISVGLILSASLVSRSQDSSGAADPVFRAMTDELQRSITELQFKDLDKPYFIQYIVVDQERFRASATFGALTGSLNNRVRYLQAQVRVGDYDFDNSEFVAGAGFQAAPAAGVTTQTVVDNEYGALRHSLWLITDASYKQAVEQLARKRAFVQNKIRGDQIPDFSKEQPVTVVRNRRSLEIDRHKWEKQVREWSALFKDFPEVGESSVIFEAQLTHRYLVNSEGTRTLQPAMLVSLEVDASTEAADGMRLRHWIPFNVAGFDQLPTAPEITKVIRQMATDLTALRSAPVLDADYSGPALFTGQASAEMFARVLAPNLSGQRLPLSDQQQATNRSELVDRMNRPVLPRFLSVFDDPTTQRLGNQELLGHYQVDDQGVPAKRVSLIEQGVLKSFLMSRRPRNDMPQSNGHGRSGIPGRETAQIGNLFIQSSEGKSFDDLKKQLIELCEQENLQYGILIKSLVSDGRSPIGTPVLTYKVHVADGREELIRGALAQGIPIRSLRQIEAVGNDAFVVNRLSGSSDLPTPTSIVAPSVLLEEIELKRPTGTQQKPALMTHPYFNKN